MRALIAVSLLALGCGAPGALVDGGVDDAEPRDAARADAPRVDGGFDLGTLPPCTLTSTRVGLELSPLVSPRGDARDALEHRAFFALHVLGTSAVARSALDGSATLAPLTSAREAAFRDAASTCGADAACLRAGLAIAPADVDLAVTATLRALEDSGVTSVVASAFRESHVFERFSEESDSVLVRTALIEAIAALHAALDAYAIGELAAGDLEEVVIAVALEAPAGSLAWWEPLSRSATLATLRAGRDEAVRYEPIDDGENAAAMAAIASIDWDAFPYAALLVPGQGPTEPETVLHPNSALRASLAAERWRAGLAPLLVLSGGHVHPDRTPYSEAIEMKRYLMTTHGIPESAILVDPYARHTTTNLRNVTRVLLRAGVPSDRRILIVTDLFQTLYVRDSVFERRCEEELHYLPFDALEALSPTDTCMTMSPLSLTVDATDLLDP